MKRNAFTLTEILVVMVIIGLLMTGVLTLLPSISAKAKTAGTKGLMQRLELACTSYKGEYRSLPLLPSPNHGTTTMSQILSLLQDNNKENYLDINAKKEMANDVLVDSWHRPIRLIVDDRSTFYLISDGNDETAGVTSLAEVEAEILLRRNDAVNSTIDDIIRKITK